MNKTVMYIFAIALAGASARAQKPGTIEWNGPAPFVGVQAPLPDGLTKIFSNLGPATAPYVGSAWLVQGPNNSAAAAEQFVALPFSSKNAAHVEQVQAAVQWVSGTNQLNISIYSNVGNKPGKLLRGPVTVTNLPTYFTCCQLAVANFSPSLAIAAKAKYWIVANTPASGAGSDFSGTWSFNPSKLLVGFDEGNGWFTTQGNEDPAAAVYGTIP